jgi:quercetin dioxygenase-like cupin family protein
VAFYQHYGGRDVVPIRSPTGRAELHIEGPTIVLEPGDSWVVPNGAAHSYTMLEPLSAVEATAPPAHAHGRDER